MESINLKNLLITVFIISWLGVLPNLLIAYGVEIPDAFGNLEILMTLGPIIGAIIFIYKASGMKGLKAFFLRLFRFKAALYVILFAILFPILVSFLSSWIGLEISDTKWPEAYTLSNIISNGLIIFLMYLIINTEELVWRGIVFDKFLDKYGFLKSCLYLIPIWWLFHIPLFLFPDGHQAGYGLIEFTCIVIAQTFILGWIYIKTNKSLFYVHVHHQLINGFGQAFPIFPVFIMGNKYPIWVLCALLLVVTGILILNRPKENPVKPISS
ncbi:MAG: CPBP family intramembrane metalloprotease [Bacteroidia bacterium]|nr:CPBP family intramembrane metalloprotease [Bacteroidia bacterium]MBT8286457.1 CPBP family intramembrane metalloprotease [Bacteroidia bacterium]NNK73372.1 CPBP family intramembrane metalloprotease [Flavobacteriaceae bacterium]